VNGLGVGQSVREDVNGRPRLHELDKLDDGRLLGRGVEVTDKTALASHLLAGHRDAICDWPGGTLNRGGGDPEAISAAVRRIELVDVNRLPRRRAEECDGVILNAEHALAHQLHLMLILEAVTLLAHRRLWTVGNGEAQ